MNAQNINVLLSLHEPLICLGLQGRDACDGKGSDFPAAFAFVRGGARKTRITVWKSEEISFFSQNFDG